MSAGLRSQAVSPTWRTATEITPTVDGWAPDTIRQGLAAMSAEGLIERRLVPHPSGQVSQYRRVDR